MQFRFAQIVFITLTLAGSESLVSAHNARLDPSVQKQLFAKKQFFEKQFSDKSKPGSQSPDKQSEQQPDFSSLLAIESPEERVQALRKYLAENRESPQEDTLRELLTQSLAVMAEQQLSAQNIESAIDHFQQALKSSPARITDKFFETTLIRIPLAVAVRGYRNEAVLLAREVEAKCAESSVRLGAVGEFYLSLEMVTDAQRALEAAVRIGPEDARLHRTLGVAYRMALRLEDALNEYKRAIELDPADKRAYYEMANMQRAHGAYEDAIRLYEKQREVDPTHTASIKGQALVYLAQGKTDKAEKALAQLKTEDLADDYYLQTQTALSYLIQGQTSQARQSAERAVGIESRFTWARIAAAEVDLVENRLFDAEKHLLAAAQFGNFPTLHFTLGKVYLAAEDYEGALVQFAKAFRYDRRDGFVTKLGGVREARAEKLADLLLREQQAALYLFEPLTSWTQFRTAETLVRLEEELRSLSVENQESEKGAVSSDSNKAKSLENVVNEFTEAEPLRSPFRKLYIAQRLARSGQYPELAVKYADEALSQAEEATKDQGSLRDYPNYDRDSRLRIFRGRASDARGWALFKAGKTTEAIESLSAAVNHYGELPEAKRAGWHLATARESTGALKESLDLYLASYEAPESGSSDLNRKVIETLYRRIYGSLKGLNERLGKPAESSPDALATTAAAVTPRAETKKSFALKPSLPESTQNNSAATTAPAASPPATDAAQRQSVRLFAKDSAAFAINMPKSDLMISPMEADKEADKEVDKKTAEVAVSTESVSKEKPDSAESKATENAETEKITVTEAVSAVELPVNQVRDVQLSLAETTAVLSTLDLKIESVEAETPSLPDLPIPAANEKSNIRAEPESELLTEPSRSISSRPKIIVSAEQPVAEAPIVSSRRRVVTDEINHSVASIRPRIVQATRLREVSPSATRKRRVTGQ
jgi:tetratricopeptide (TPR) repeat protein